MDVPRWRWLATGILVTATATLAGCATGTPGERSGSARPTTTTTNAEQVSVATCKSDQIAVVAITAGVGAGSTYQELGFLNVSTSPCTLKGWPSVTLLNSAGVQAGQSTPSLTAPGTAPPASVTLSPGDAATATVQGSDGSVTYSSSCATYPWFLVTPPGITQATPPGSSLTTKVAVGLPISTSGFHVCGPTRIISPVTPAGAELTG